MTIGFGKHQGKTLAQVKSGPELFTAVKADTQKNLRIGVYDKSPGATWLARHGWEDQAKIYPMLSPNPEQYPGEIIERDLANGAIDAAIVWGPIAGYYAKRVTQPALRVLTMNSEQGVQFDYAMAMGVRYGEPEWKKQGRHTESGPYTPEDWLRIYAAHLEGHARQIERSGVVFSSPGEPEKLLAQRRTTVHQRHHLVDVRMVAAARPVWVDVECGLQTDIPSRITKGIGNRHAALDRPIVEVPRAKRRFHKGHERQGEKPTVVTHQVYFQPRSKAIEA